MTTVPFRERVQRDKFPITYEIISPRDANVDACVEGVKSLPCLDALAGINITSNPSARVRIDPGALSHLLMDHVDVDMIPHMTVREETVAALQRWLFGAWALGVRNALVMTGDHPKEGDYPAEERVDSLNAIELVTGMKRYLAKGHLIPDVAGAAATRYANRFNPPPKPKTVTPIDFCVGSPCIPWRNNEVKYADAKRRAGTDFFQSQITWDAKAVLPWLEEAEEAGIIGPKSEVVTYDAEGREVRDVKDVPVLIGTSPLKTLRTMTFMHKNIPFVKVPKDLQKRLKGAKDCGWESVEACIEMIHDLKDGVKARGLKTRVGLHMLPINDDALAGEIIRRTKET